MAENKRDKIYLGIIALVLVCTILGTLGGAVAGGAAGYYLGRRVARAEVQRLPLTRGEQVTPNGPLPEIPPDWNFQWPEGQQPSRGEVNVVARVEVVTAGSPAERAGLRVDDRITAVNGEKLTPARGLAEIVGGHKVGDRLELSVQRAGKEEKLPVTLGENPDRAGQPYLGVTYRTVIVWQNDSPTN